MKKQTRNIFVSVMLIALFLGLTASWQATSASQMFQPVPLGTELQSKAPQAPEAAIDCSRSPNFVPNSDGTSCVFQCPAGKIPAWGGTCKEKDPGESGGQSQPDNNPCKPGKAPTNQKQPLQDC